LLILSLGTKLTAHPPFRPLPGKKPEKWDAPALLTQVTMGLR